MGKDPERVINLQAVQRHYQRHFTIVMGTGGTIGEARNNGAFQAIDQGAELLFFVDADVIVPIESVILATKIADLTGSGVYPYGKITRLFPAERKEYIERGTLPPRTDGLPEGGALVLSRQGFIQTCGFPETNYGEDNILHNAMQCFLGPIVRIWEPAYHLWHPEGSSDGYIDTKAVQIVRATENAVDSPDKMRTIFRKAGYHDLPRFTAAGYRP